ncbi:MAG: dihydropteroate synthase [bacterium]
MTLYLGLGANEGDRARNLERAIEHLVAAGFRLERVSPLVESPALLPPDADPTWCRPYLNLAVRGEADWSPQQGLAIAKQIERELGRGADNSEHELGCAIGDDERAFGRAIGNDERALDRGVGNDEREPSRVGDDERELGRDVGNDERELDRGAGDDELGHVASADEHALDRVIADDEHAPARIVAPKWAPRPIDIDLLWWRGERLDSAALKLPHPDAARRDFVLTPLLHLQSDLAVGARGEHVFELTDAVRPIPLWMAIINLTPDSFSDGGEWSDSDALDAYFEKLIARNVQIIDLGAESTRPRGARDDDEPLDAEQEWARLEPALAMLEAKLRGRRIKPWLSVDSRKPSVIERALRYGIDVINDVGGLADPAMIALARDSGCQVVAMHSLSVPADAAVTLPRTPGAATQVAQWARRRMEMWDAAGLDFNRIILDPGIGFGKTATQSLALLSSCRELRRAGLRLLVGHSRKSFLATAPAPATAPAAAAIADATADAAETAPRPAPQRDLETLGVSLALCRQGVDILRVHSPFIHQRAALAWAHVAPE